MLARVRFQINFNTFQQTEIDLPFLMVAVRYLRKTSEFTHAKLHRTDAKSLLTILFCLYFIYISTYPESHPARLAPRFPLPG